MNPSIVIATSSPLPHHLARHGQHLRSGLVWHAGSERDRALVYCLLSAHLGGPVLRPGQILAMRLDGRHQEQGRVTWDIPAKNASSEATVRLEIPRDTSLAIDDYLPHRVHVPDAGSHPASGPLFTSEKRTRGQALTPGPALVRILDRVAAGHPVLGKLRPDDVAHTRPAPAAPPEG